ncbi:Vp7 [Banna virus]|uniref:Vp7 n=1 Tax=Banna virus TaxID=77763 RepID=Q9YWQ4_BANNV|nr:Vp7 [Banna virus]
MNNGQATINRIGDKFEIRCRHLDRDYTMPLPNATTNNNFLGCIKFITEHMGFDYVSMGFKICANVDDFQHLNGNSTLMVGKTTIGPLILKKIRSLPCCNDALFKNKYRILARMHGILRLKNDRNNFKYGVILEYCYKPMINFSNFITAISDLNDLHSGDQFYLHGDVNPENIMSDANGYLKLVDPVCLLENQVNMVNIEYESLTQEAEKKVFLKSLVTLVERQLSARPEDIYADLSSENPSFNLTNGMRLTDLLDRLDATNVNQWKSLINHKPMLPSLHALNDLTYYKLCDDSSLITEDLDDEDDV